MPIKWYYILLFIIILIIFFRIFYNKIENIFVFFPQTELEFYPEGRNLSYKDVYFSSESGEKLHGWFFKRDSVKEVALFCHGNAGNISHRLENVSLLFKRGTGVFIYDYRGYGKSTGKPTEKGIYEDGLAAYDHLVRNEKILPEDIILFGRSLGASVAIEIALNRKVRSIIIESGFTSTRDMAKTMFPFSLLSFLMPSNYNNLEKISHVIVPKLIIHGAKDKIVPFHMGKSLFDASGDPKFFMPLENAGHNDTYVVGGEKYFRALGSFIRYSTVSPDYNP